MHFSSLAAFSLPLIGSFAMALPQGTNCVESSSMTTATSTSAAAISSPTAPFTLLSAHTGTRIHLLPVNANNQTLILGGETASACPEPADTQCPSGNVTAFLGLCAMDVEVPGGQYVYVTPEGAFKFTGAHAGGLPPGAVGCPWTYSKDSGSEYGIVTTSVFGATGLMGCPTSVSGVYDVFAQIPNATVPSGNVNDCIGFDGLAYDFSGIAAWQYE